MLAHSHIYIIGIYGAHSHPQTHLPLLSRKICRAFHKKRKPEVISNPHLFPFHHYDYTKGSAVVTDDDDNDDDRGEWWFDGDDDDDGMVMGYVKQEENLCVCTFTSTNVSVMVLVVVWWTNEQKNSCTHEARFGWTRNETRRRKYISLGLLRTHSKPFLTGYNNARHHFSKWRLGFWIFWEVICYQGVVFCLKIMWTKNRHSFHELFCIKALLLFGTVSFRFCEHPMTCSLKTTHQRNNCMYEILTVALQFVGTRLSTSRMITFSFVFFSWFSNLKSWNKLNHVTKQQKHRKTFINLQFSMRLSQCNTPIHKYAGFF